MTTLILTHANTHTHSCMSFDKHQHTAAAEILFATLGGDYINTKSMNDIIRMS